MTPKEAAREARPLSQGASWGLQSLTEKSGPWEGRRRGTEKTGALGGSSLGGRERRRGLIAGDCRGLLPYWLLKVGRATHLSAQCQ